MSRFFQPALNLKRLVDNSFKAIDEGLYETKERLVHDSLMLRKAILTCDHAPLITEIKFASPSLGKIRDKSSPTAIANTMVSAGAIGLSVLTQPYLFDGSIDYLAKIRKAVAVPLLMKDIVVSRVQIDAAKNAGADCVLLIKSVFDRDLAEEDLETMKDYCAKKGLQLLVEAHTEQEYNDLVGSGFELVGINNRDLETLRVDIRNTEKLIGKFGKGKSVVVSESGIAQAADIRYLHEAGADAFLVGTSIMESEQLSDKVKELYLSL